jgi:hypothetical protein
MGPFGLPSGYRVRIRIAAVQPNSIQGSGVEIVGPARVISVWFRIERGDRLTISRDELDELPSWSPNAGVCPGGGIGIVKNLDPDGVPTWKDVCCRLAWSHGGRIPRRNGTTAIVGMAAKPLAGTVLANLLMSHGS